MQVKSYGNSTILLKSNKAKLITNPKSEGAKVNLKALAPEIVLLTEKNELPDDSFYVISSPGEFEVQDIFVYGYKSDLSGDNQQADVYMVDIAKVHLGIIDKSVDKIRDWVLNEMNIANVLFVPLTEGIGMKLSKVADFVNKIDPWIIVPMDYSKESLGEFIRIIGVKDVEKVDSLDLKHTDFTEEDMPTRCVVFEK